VKVCTAFFLQWFIGTAGMRLSFLDLKVESEVNLNIHPANHNLSGKALQYLKCSTFYSFHDWISALRDVQMRFCCQKLDEDPIFGLQTMFCCG
jgi:hypothetical protein